MGLGRGERKGDWDAGMKGGCQGMHCLREDKTRREGNGKCDEGG